MEETVEARDVVGSSLVPDLAAAFVRGGVEFACAASLIVPLIAMMTSRTTGEELAAGWAGLVLGGAFFALAPAAWEHARTAAGKRLVLLLTGFGAALATLGPFLAVPASPGAGAILAFFGFTIGLGLGLGQAIAGVPFERISLRDGAFSLREAAPRAVMIVSYTSLLVLVPFFAAALGLAGASVHALANASSLLLYVFPALTLARCVIAPWAEEATRKALEKKPPASTRESAIAEWRESLALANLTTNPEIRRGHLEKALEGARIAYAFALGTTEHLDLSEDRRRYLELIFLLGKTDEIETALARFCEGPGLQAELARLRGEPEAAVALAEQAIAQDAVNATDRANALSVLALAEAELGRFDSASERLVAIERAQRMVRPLVPRFRASAIAVEIERRRARAGSKDGA